MTTPTPAHTSPATAVRIWDLPTRLFHWLLAAAVIGLVITGNVGGNAMNWHFRLGYAVLALLVFRLLWGLVGGRWSRFASFFPTPGRLWRYLRGSASAVETAGHNPLGALAVLAMLGLLALQVFSGLMTDDEIAFTGPLVARVPGEWVSWATSWHSNWGAPLLMGLIGLHLLALLVHRLLGHRLVKAMVLGDKTLAEPVPPAQDSAATRLLALLLAALAAGGVWLLLWWATPTPLG